MAGLTKDELKQALISHGVETNLKAAKKDELVQLYEEFVAPHEENAGQFSSDDESLTPTKRTSSRRASAKIGGSPRVSAKAATPKSVTPRVSAKAATPKSVTPRVSAKSATNGDVAEVTEAVEEAVNVGELNDEELALKLKEHGVEVGPIVDSTRTLYQNKLQVILRGGDANGANDSVESAGSNGEVEEETEVKTTTPRVSAKAATPKSVTPRVSQRSTRSTRVSTRSNKSAAEFSADEEEVDGANVDEANEAVIEEASEDSDDQPSVVVKEATPKPASSRSPLQNLGQSIRQRFSGTSTTEKKSDRFTPTPRRSIHSYKVTETTRKTVTKDKDGNIIEDISVDKVTSETDGKIEPAGRLARLLRVLPGLLLLLILAALAYYVTAKRK